MSMSKFATKADYWKDRALSYEAANAEQGKLLNEVIKERDELLVEMVRLKADCGIWGGEAMRCIPRIDAAIAKSKP